MERLHILHVASTTGEGGIERCAVDLARRLRTSGARVTFACRPGGFVEARCRALGLPTLPFHPRKNGDPAQGWRLAGWMRGHGVTLVHVHSRRDYLTAALASSWAWTGRRPAPRLVLHAHLLQPLGELRRASGWFFARAAAAIIAVSDAVREDLLAHHRLPPGLVTRLYNGVDLSAFAVPEHVRWASWRASLRREWGVPPDALVVGMVGRLHDKGQDALLEAAPGLLARFPDARLVLVGPGDAARCRARAEAAGVAGRTIVPGPSERIPAVLAGFDVLAHLPTDEAFGLALVEGMAAGLPTVATAVGGCAEAVRDGETGFLIPPGDPDALRDCLARLLDPATGAALRGEMGRAGRRRAEREFSDSRWVEGVQRLYARILDPAPRRGRPAQ